MQTDIFGMMYENYKIEKPIRLIELFAGYGSQSLALKYLGIEHENYKVVEFDKYAIQSYNEIHETDFPLLDITEISAKDLEIVDTNIYIYILTYSFPCQDLSLAGKRKGMTDTSTRSGLLWEVERLLDECEELPQILLMENVPQVIGKDNVEHFNKWQQKLEDLGYSNYHQNLIATDYGIPQTRNRTFMISILGNYSYTFPKPIPLELKLKDMLEDEVDESYYLSDKQINQVQNWNAYEKPLENMEKTNKSQKSPTITTRSGAFAAGMILIPEATKKGYAEATNGDGVYINRPHQKRGVVQKDKIQTLKTSLDVGVVVGTYQYSKSDNFMQGRNRFQESKEVADTIQTTPKEGVVIETNLKAQLCNELIESGRVKENDVIKHSYTSNKLDDDRLVPSHNVSPTLDTRCDCLGVAQKQERDLRIRKLTPREAFRLMGVKDEDYDKLTCSNAQKYKQAGNSIVVNVLMAIFKQLF